MRQNLIELTPEETRAVIGGALYFASVTKLPVLSYGQTVSPPRPPHPAASSNR